MFAKALASESLIVSDLYPTFTGRDVAFIHQDDSFFTMLSVVETLALASQLRLPSEDATFQRLAMEDAISAMALIAVKDSQVGTPWASAVSAVASVSASQWHVSFYQAQSAHCR